MSNTILSLKSICKQYRSGDNTVDALKNITLNFRKKEFVSIVGASGSGKTTLLNIIGGLDNYTSGDLIIKGRSTKGYKDKDWDIYRNHNIGFVFQAYNLIMHQSILTNVELALTLAGISSAERKERAIAVLNRVGLGKHIHKKPNQLSGGQMQRVAIARALINNPEILLADEPTGALDSHTSVQIMDLIQEIAGERLVIMVTHNPELAEEYSSRIIRFQDGDIVSDSNPYYEEYEETEAQVTLKTDSKEQENVNSTIINDALQAEQFPSLAEQIKAYDNGEDVAAKIEQKNAESTSVDIEKQQVGTRQSDNLVAIEGKSGVQKKDKTSMSFATAFALSAKNLLSKKARSIMTAIAGSIGIISVCLVLAFSNGFSMYMRSMQEDMLSSSPMQLSERTTDITTALKNGGLGDKLNAIKDFASGNQVGVNNLLTTLAQGAMIRNDLNTDVVKKVQTELAPYTNAVTTTTGVEFYDNIFTTYSMRKITKVENWPLPIIGKDIFERNYSITELKAYFRDVISAFASNFLDYERIINNMPCVSVLPDSNVEAGANLNFVKSQYDLMTGSWPTNKNEAILVLDAKNRASDITLTQLGFLDSSVFIMNIFGMNNSNSSTQLLEDKTEIVQNQTRANDGKTVSYDEILGKEYTAYFNDAVYTENSDTTKPFDYIYDGNKANLNIDDSSGLKIKIKGIVRLKSGLNSGCLQEGLNLTDSFVNYYLEKNRDNKFTDYIKNITDLSKPPKVGIQSYDMTLEPLKDVTAKYTNAQPASEVQKLVGARETVASISIYAKSFKDKTSIVNWFNNYNAGQTDRTKRLTYTDSVSTIMDMMNEMMTIITIVLVAFTGISLLVSTVMIGIITFVSVVERTKEIGILRSIGARKRDIRTLFNMETFIIGLIAGLFGVLVTYILQIPINLIMMSMFNIQNIANLQVWVALIMVFVSVGLTLLSGLIPASAAAKKEPVIALRS